MTRPGVLLAHSLYLGHDTKQLQRMRPYSPLATLLAAAALRQQGCEVRLFDATFAGIPDIPVGAGAPSGPAVAEPGTPGIGEFEAALDGEAPAVVAVVEDNFNFVTKMCTAQMRADTLAMVTAAKARGCRVVVNGSDAVDHPGRYLAAGADAVIVSEVEPALTELVEAWTGPGDVTLDRIAGLALPHGAEVRRTAPRPYMNDLDALPLPAWDLIDPDRYRSAWTRAHGRMSWNMATSRGCPYGCNWCAKPLWGRRYAQRSPELVVEELVRLRADIGADHIWFADDIFGLTPAWIEQFARLVHERAARIPFMMQSRVNLMTPRVVAALADAGAEEVWLGVESGAQSVLDAMDKGSTLEQIAHATEALKAAGIRCAWFLMLGYPGEAWDEIVATRDLIRTLGPDEVGVSVAYPLPGTVFYDRVRAGLGVRRNWQDTDELAMLFPGAYGTDFYRQIRDLLHAEVSGAERRLLDARWSELASGEPAARRARHRTERPGPVAQLRAAGD
jgi:anaerobic magnesium-protoporphyrin IX monomethyl ester cyclase